MLDWEKANRRVRRSQGLGPDLARKGHKPPTAKQLALLRKLADERRMTFAMPRTSAQASARIKELLATKKPK